MTDSANDLLYNLLPAIYRIRDAKLGEPLRALLKVIDEQVQELQDDISGLYEDWFIETCNDWVIPYIGDMVGNKPLYSIKQLRRADVAKTIYYRRRKGTAAMLEEMARDVTGWGAHVVEFFQLLGWTQNLNHLRYNVADNPMPESLPAVDCIGTVNLRSMDVIDRLNGPFDVISHTVDIRPINNYEGWYNIRKIGFFLWWLNPYVLSNTTPRAVEGHDGFYTFSRLGNLSPVFNKPQREDDDVRLANETQVPGPIRPMAFKADMDACRELSSSGATNSDYYGPDRSLNIIKDGNPVPPEKIKGMDLSTYNRPKKTGMIGIDVKNGLIGFAEGDQLPDSDDMSQFNVTYTYGFCADIGGGSYERRQDMVEVTPEATVLEVGKNKAITSINGALQQWDREKPCVIRICDSGVYEESLSIELPDKGWLMLQADNTRWPDIRCSDISIQVDSPGTATLIMDGLLIEGSLELSGGLNLTLQHCTLVPGQTLEISGEAKYPESDSIDGKNTSNDLSVTIKKSIVGSLRMPADSQCLYIQDSIVQSPLQINGMIGYAISADPSGTKPGPPMYLERDTILGHVLVKELVMASETIFTGQVEVRRQQKGCVRFSYVPSESITPRRYRCQPDLALEAATAELNKTLTADEEKLVLAKLKPRFTSTRYGEPGYAQLSLNCAEEICTGAEDGSEIGVFSSLKQPQRKANLSIRLKEYLPLGMEPGYIYIT